MQPSQIETCTLGKQVTTLSTLQISPAIVSFHRMYAKSSR